MFILLEIINKGGNNTKLYSRVGIADEVGSCSMSSFLSPPS
jgi:hypothetical protein